MIGLGDRPAFLQLLEAAVGNSNRVATAKPKMGEVKPKNGEFSEDYTEC